MKILLDIPLVMSLAGWIWGDDDASTGVSPELCVEGFPFTMAVGCWTRLLAKGVGIAIIVLSCLNKAPVMRNILKSQSTAGLSRFAVYGETIVYANCAFYGILERYPISAYGENVSMLIQSIIIILMMYQFQDDPRVSTKERFAALTFGILYVVFVMTALPSHLYHVLMASIFPIMLCARGSQIITTFQLKQTGTLSIITTSMSFAGSLVRILTTIKEIGWDFAVLNGYFLSVGLNSILCVQYWYYRPNTIRFLKELDEKKKQDEKKKAE